MAAADLYFEEQGTGPALVLLHGFPMDGRIWADQLNSLSKIARVIVPDLRGFGRSASSEPFTLETLADDIHRLLTKLKAIPCVLGGLSMGGYTSFAFAKKYASGLSGLILVDTRAEADTPQGKQGRDEMIATVRRDGTPAIAQIMRPKLLAPDAAPAVVEKLNEIMLGCPPLTIAHALEAMRDREDYTEELSRIGVPSLVIVGERDVITPPAMAESMCKRLRRSRLVVVPGAGHVTPMEQPRVVSQAMEEFVSGI